MRCRAARRTGLLLATVLIATALTTAGSQDLVAVDASSADFVPTEDWQEIVPGQDVPETCDWKVELATGKEFARKRPPAPAPGVIEEADPGVEEEFVDTAEARAETAAKMFRVLLGLPKPPPELGADKLHSMPPAELEALIAKLWARRQQFLKETYSDTQTEQDILEGHLNMLKLLKSPEHDDDLETILGELEYLVMQTDNARTLANLKGWPTIVRTLNITTDAVATAAAWVVGTAVKLDNQVQNAALDAAVMPKLVALLRPSEDTTGGRARGVGVRTKATFALGHLLRNNHRAQQLFVRNAGPELLLDELRAVGRARASQGLLKKILALVSDLVGQEGKALPSLVSELHSTKWCEAVAGAAAQLGAESDARLSSELAIKAMLELQTAAASPSCDEALFGNGRAAIWARWHAQWDAEAQLPGDDGAYQEGLAELAESLLKRQADAGAQAGV
jgi:hypothetical protein